LLLFSVSVSGDRPCVITGTLNNPVQNLSESYLLQIERDEWLKRLTGGDAAYEGKRENADYGVVEKREIPQRRGVLRDEVVFVLGFVPVGSRLTQEMLAPAGNASLRRTA
jgi:hypothetical protein